MQNTTVLVIAPLTFSIYSYFKLKINDLTVYFLFGFYIVFPECTRNGFALFHIYADAFRKNVREYRPEMVDWVPGQEASRYDILDRDESTNPIRSHL